jgi:AcrR family transcriptional regulator
MTNPVKKRPYRSSVRQEQAASTRARILAAAGELFERDGYARTTMRQIADEAGVAADTVYAIFGSKARVLTALIDLRLTESPGMTNVLERPEVAAIRDETDQRRQIELYARGMVETLGRVGSVYEMMRSAAAVDPEVSKIFAEMQGYRLRNAHVIAGWIAANGKLRVSSERAGEIMWTIASPEVGRLLRGGRGWTADEHIAWLADTLARTLLRDARPKKPAPKRTTRSRR